MPKAAMLSWMVTNRIPFRGDRNDNKTRLALAISAALRLEIPVEGERHPDDLFMFLEIKHQKLSTKLRNWEYSACYDGLARGDREPTRLNKDLVNAANHWEGDHSNSVEFNQNRRCVIWQPPPI